MFVLEIALTDLGLLTDTGDLTALSPDEIIARVRGYFKFLGTDLNFEVRDGRLLVSRAPVGEKPADEADRLVDRASKRAQSGEYARAAELLERALQMNPTLQQSWRDLAMVRMELGKFDDARDALIDALRLNPRDAWSHVVLANLYAKQRNDFAKARIFYQRALELKPEDPWALNGFAAAEAEAGHNDEAVKLFNRAIAAEATLANPYCGKAMVLLRGGRAAEAVETLERMFATAKAADARGTQILTEGRQIYSEAQHTLAKSTASDGFKAVEDYRRSTEVASGYPVLIEDGPLEASVAARVQIAWKHGRERHRITIRESIPADEPQRHHLVAHELTHIRLESAARAAGKNRIFLTTEQTRLKALEDLEPDLRRLRQRGHADEVVNGLANSLIRGVCGFLFNCPIDMLIEGRLRSELPPLRHIQFMSLTRLANEAKESTLRNDIRSVAPQRIWRATSALNGAYALFLDDVLGGTTGFWAPYSALETAPMSRKLWARWQQSVRTASPGSEYEWVDEFAEILGLSGWYQWKPDTGPSTHRTDTGETPDNSGGISNPELLRAKHPAAVLFLIDALRRFSKMHPNEVRSIVTEVAVLGREGIDYTTAQRNYRLSSLPGDQFSGLHLMCLMFAGLKKIAPHMDANMDLEEPFLTALEAFNREELEKGGAQGP